MENNLVAIVRKNYGLTQKKLAEVVGVTRNYIALVERGKKPLTQKLTEKINKKINIIIKTKGLKMTPDEQESRINSSLEDQADREELAATDKACRKYIEAMVACDIESNEHSVALQGYTEAARRARILHNRILARATKIWNEPIFILQDKLRPKNIQLCELNEGDLFSVAPHKFKMLGPAQDLGWFRVLCVGTGANLEWPGSVAVSKCSVIGFSNKG